MARNTFNTPAAPTWGRVKRIDFRLSIVEVDVPEVPEVPEVPAVLAEDGVTEITPAVPAVPAVPAHTVVDYDDMFEFYRPDTTGGDPAVHSGKWRDHLTTAQRNGLQGLLDSALAKANGE